MVFFEYLSVFWLKALLLMAFACSVAAADGTLTYTLNLAESRVDARFSPSTPGTNRFWVSQDLATWTAVDERFAGERTRGFPLNGTNKLFIRVRAANLANPESYQQRINAAPGGPMEPVYRLSAPAWTFSIFAPTNAFDSTTYIVHTTNSSYGIVTSADLNSVFFVPIQRGTRVSPGQFSPVALRRFVSGDTAYVELVERGVDGSYRSVQHLFTYPAPPARLRAMGSAADDLSEWVSQKIKEVEDVLDIGAFLKKCRDHWDKALNSIPAWQEEREQKALREAVARQTEIMDAAESRHEAPLATQTPSPEPVRASPFAHKICSDRTGQYADNESFLDPYTGLCVEGVTGRPQTEPPLKLIITRGQDQSPQAAGTRLPEELVVRVVDQNDRPIPRAVTSWLLTDSSSGGTLQVQGGTVVGGFNNSGWIEILGDSAGFASVWWTIGSSPDNHAVRVSLKEIRTRDNAAWPFVIESPRNEGAVEFSYALDLTEKYRKACLGWWTVENLESGTVYDLEVKDGGVGVYHVGSGYPMRWEIRRSGNEYRFYEWRFWHPAFDGLPRDPLTLPVTGFYTYFQGNKSLRYTKK